MSQRPDRRILDTSAVILLLVIEDPRPCPWSRFVPLPFDAAAARAFGRVCRIPTRLRTQGTCPFL